MAPSSFVGRVAAIAALAFVPHGEALAPPSGLKARITSINEHHPASGEVQSFVQTMSRAEALATTEAELMQALVEDPSLGSALKSALKNALGKMASTLSQAAKENCEKLVEKVEQGLDNNEDSASSLEDLILSADDDTALLQQQDNSTEQGGESEDSTALIQQRDMSEGIFDKIKEKTRVMYDKMKGAAKKLMAELSRKMAPVLESMIKQILPTLQKEAAALMSKACDYADKKLETIQDRFSE